MAYAPNPPLSATALREMLLGAFPHATITVRDDTHLHAGHNAAVGHGGGHFKVHIVWDGFAALTRPQRHRLVHAALAEPWRHGRIHALTLKLEPAPSAS